jgi:phage tail-like protein
MTPAVEKNETLPDFTGLPLERALKLVRHLELEPGAVRFTESKAPQDTVVRQDPAAGSPMERHEEVHLWISRSSYIRHLPSLYQENGGEAVNFLQEYLWIFQHLFRDIEQKLENVPRYLDAYTAPTRFLPWLASWVALKLDPDWPEIKQRLLIRRMVEIYNYRGTAYGLALYLEIFTGVQPVIHENQWPFPGFQVGEAGDVGIDAIILPPITRAHCFIVELPMSADDLSLETIYKIHRIIEVEKPAHTRYILRFRPPEEAKEAPGFRIGFTALREEDEQAQEKSPEE